MLAYLETLSFMYISDGNYLSEWKDDETGSMIGILAIGTGEDSSIELVDKILEGHEIGILIFPMGENREALERHFEKRGVSRLLTGSGCLNQGEWDLTYWTDNGHLNVIVAKNAVKLLVCRV